MSIDRINLDHTAPIDGTRGAGAAMLAETGARAIASTVVARIASELALASPAQPLAGAGSDLYGLGALADSISGQLGASPTETGDLQRALEAFAGSIAADMTAMADGRTFDRVDAALARFPTDDAAGVVAITQSFEAAAEAIAEAR